MKVVIMIGATGSGKSHYIRHELPRGARVFSADDFFTDVRGAYNFDKEKLPEAHQDCMYRFISAIHNTALEDQVFVIDNTNVSIAQVAPYIAVARAHRAEVELVWMREDRLEVCHGRNVHGAPIEVIRLQLRALRYLRDHWPRFWPTPTVWPPRG